MQHIAVCYGGWSSEREVSLKSGQAVYDALMQAGKRVTLLDVDHNIAAALQKAAPDVVFNALHGTFGEDGGMQGVLEMLGMPYTHSGVLASALAMDKARAKVHFAAAGLTCAEGGLYCVRDIRAGTVPFTHYVVKPPADGSSVGVSIIRRQADIAKLDKLSDDAMMLVEHYHAGREVQVAVLDGVALGAIEITSDNEFYDYDAKYSAGKSRHIMPALLEEARYNAVLRAAEAAHTALGCHGLTRSDFIVSDDGYVLLELNTQPGFTPTSLAPEIAAHAGLSFTQLVLKMLVHATTDTMIKTDAVKKVHHG